MDVKKKDVGNRIKSIRSSKGMTLEEFGKLFGASKGNVATWEKGSSLPNNERLFKIAELGEITVDELLYGDKKMYLINKIEEELSRAERLFNDDYFFNYRNTIIENVLHDFELYTDFNDLSYSEIDKHAKTLTEDYVLNAITDTRGLITTIDIDLRDLISRINIYTGKAMVERNLKVNEIDIGIAEQAIKSALYDYAQKTGKVIKGLENFNPKEDEEHSCH